MQTPSTTARVFVSSTWKDLRPGRDAVEAALNGMHETKYWGMEHFGCHDEAPHEVSLAEVDRSDLYVGIIGGRYGSGITEEEYRRAREHDLPCLIYFKREAAIPREEPPPEAEQAARHAAFKERLLASHTVADFSDPQELASRVMADVTRTLQDRYGTRAQPRQDTRPADERGLRVLFENVRALIEGVLKREPHDAACSRWIKRGAKSPSTIHGTLS